MKTRLLWTLILSVGLTAMYFGITQPHVSTIPSELREPLDELKPPPFPPIELPPLVIPEIPVLTVPPMQPMRPVTRADPILPRPEVPIQNQATIDFSTGAPFVITHGKDQDAIESAMKEMSEVLKNTRLEAKK